MNFDPPEQVRTIQRGVDAGDSIGGKVRGREIPFRESRQNRHALHVFEGQPGDADRALIASKERPIVVVARRPDSPIAEQVAPGQHTLGVMIPYTPLHVLLLEKSPGYPQALVMTSGNISDEPIATGNQEARQRLSALADAFLLHDREIHIRCDDSVVRVVSLPGNGIYHLRRSRGYAPNPIRTTWSILAH